MKTVAAFAVILFASVAFAQVDTEQFVKNVAVDTVDINGTTIVFRFGGGDTLTLTYNEKTKAIDADGFPIKIGELKRRDRVSIFYFPMKKTLNRLKKLD